MGVQVAEMAGGLVSLALQFLVLLAVAELACRVFFWVREREGK